MLTIFANLGKATKAEKCEGTELMTSRPDLNVANDHDDVNIDQGSRLSRVRPSVPFIVFS